MKTKQLVCNDCGCRFDIKERKESGSQPAGAERPAKAETKQASVSCPECQSYNITTA